MESRLDQHCNSHFPLQCGLLQCNTLNNIALHYVKMYCALQWIVVSRGCPRVTGHRQCGSGYIGGSSHIVGRSLIDRNDDEHADVDVYNDADADQSKDDYDDHDVAAAVADANDLLMSVNMLMEKW